MRGRALVMVPERSLRILGKAWQVMGRRQRQVRRVHGVFFASASRLSHQAIGHEIMFRHGYVLIVLSLAQCLDQVCTAACLQSAEPSG